MCVKIKFIIDRNLANCDTPVFCLLSCKIPSSGRQSSVRASVLPCAHLTPEDTGLVSDLTNKIIVC